jgi:hypothetical protein
MVLINRITQHFRTCGLEIRQGFSISAKASHSYSFTAALFLQLAASALLLLQLEVKQLSNFF